ncbi:hypothetical protein KR009_010511 [Drosophila setifemur]|nr:hypothetical protein KR009_010511 [Drosophila setifemur]
MKTTGKELAEPIRMEDFLRPQYMQKLAQMVHFQWRRNPENNRLENPSMRPFVLSAILNVAFFGCNVCGILGQMLFGSAGNLNPPIISITSYFSIRGLMLYLKRREIVDFVNDMDREFPRDVAAQLEMKLDQTYGYFLQRYRFLQIYTHVGGPIFCLLPYGLFLLTHEGPDVPVATNEQLLGGWMPFGIRQQTRFYFPVWFFDVMCTACGVSFFLTFDNLFNVMQSILISHLNYLSQLITDLDPGQSATNEAEFFTHLKTLVRRQQLLNELCRRYNDIFKVAFLVSNFVGAGSLCFMLFMLSEASDIVVIGQYILPTMVLVLFTFEICLRGTQLEEASAGLNLSLTNQEWYLGSQRYRKFFLLWLQYSQQTQKLGAFGLIEVNMVHFTDIMQLAYRLFTFLKSH